MTVRPDFGPEYGEDEWQAREVLPDDQEAEEEREVEEQELESQETAYLDPESNELHAPAGQTCPRCGQVITADQDVRRRADGQWQHEACPVAT